jgi:hypothetical protein
VDHAFGAIGREVDVFDQAGEEVLETLAVGRLEL